MVSSSPHIYSYSGGSYMGGRGGEHPDVESCAHVANCHCACALLTSLSARRPDNVLDRRMNAEFNDRKDITTK